MKQGLKRPIQAYFTPALWIAWTIYFSTLNSTEWGQRLLFGAATIWIISLIHMFIRRNYIEVINNKLVMYESFITTTTVELDKIEKFEFQPGPFTTSKIILKDKTKLTYSDRQADFKELKEFMVQFNIPVE